MLDATPYIDALNSHARCAKQAEDSGDARTHAIALKKFMSVLVYCKNHGLNVDTDNRKGLLTLRRGSWCYGLKRCDVLYSPNHILIDGRDGYLDYDFKEQRRLARGYDQRRLARVSDRTGYGFKEKQENA